MTLPLLSIVLAGTLPPRYVVIATIAALACRRNGFIPMARENRAIRRYAL
ncbi:hypothetical protein JCM19237_3949 [Photobacterium aphoticum]|uniref:Uncharacterized protein n=1 Tax=Photobacterium aphoticum TaxID=754436 RepID=A0A090QX75_9GAMM|nr:hypothetical protein JCM19237_3949 [Photobacterium aphoticum]